MTIAESRLLAIVLAVVWVASGLVALRRQRAAAVVVNLLFAVPVCLLALGPIVRIVVDKEGYVRQYGRAALSELPFTCALLAVGLLAIVASVLSLRRRPWLFVVGWLANAPILALLIYLAFWFRIF